MVKPQQWHRLCFHTVQGVIWSAKPSSWIYAASDCWGSLSFELKQWCCAGGAFFLLVMSCRLASASSVMLHSVVNHCPSPPFYLGASLSLPALKGLKLSFCGRPEPESRDAASVPSGMSCLFPVCNDFCLDFLFFFLKSDTVPQQASQGKCYADVHEWQGGLLKTVFHKKGTLYH